MYSWNRASGNGHHIKNWPLLESWNKRSLGSLPSLYGSIFPLHSTMLYAAALVNTSYKDNEISLHMLARENPKEEKFSFPSIRNDAYLMEMHQLTGIWSVIWKEHSIPKYKSFLLHNSFATVVSKRSFLPESSLKLSLLEAPDVTVSFVTLPSSAKLLPLHC